MQVFSVWRKRRSKMFGKIFGRKKEKNKKIEDTPSNALELTSQSGGEESFVPAPREGAVLVAADEKKVKDKGVDFSAFFALAKLLNVTVEQIKDECCLYQVRNLMSRMGRVVVRYNVTDGELGKILLNCKALQIKETILSPAYIPSCAKQVAKHGLNSLYVGSLIDFPFGESTFKSKLADIKDSISAGVDGITVILPAMLLEKDKQKQFKKQVKKIGKFYKKDAGIALSAMDIDEDAVKFAFKTVEKSKVGSITFIFGETDEESLKLKMTAINKYRGKKTVKVMGNVSHPEAVMELIKFKVDEILTPFADDIGKDLIKRFKIKSVKLR